MRSAVSRLWRDELGTSTVEYALLLAVIVMASAGAWTGMRTALTHALTAATDALGE